MINVILAKRIKKVQPCRSIHQTFFTVETSFKTGAGLYTSDRHLDIFQFLNDQIKFYDFFFFGAFSIKCSTDCHKPLPTCSFSYSVLITDINYTSKRRDFVFFNTVSVSQPLDLQFSFQSPQNAECTSKLPQIHLYLISKYFLLNWK